MSARNPARLLRGTARCATAIVLLGGGFVSAAPATPAPPTAAPAAPRSAGGAVPFVPARAVFNLRTVDGREVSDSTYRGRWLLVYFGYTFCPDVCPTVLVEVGQVLKSLGPLADRIQPIFITVDPERDTASHLATYLSAFSPRIVGLRGDREQLRATARQFHVFYRTHSLGNGDYFVEHSSYLYLISPDGLLTKVLPDSQPQAQLAAELTHFVQAGSAR